jgi:hypothetical protein
VGYKKSKSKLAMVAPVAARRALSHGPPHATPIAGHWTVSQSHNYYIVRVLGCRYHQA